MTRRAKPDLLAGATRTPSLRDHPEALAAVKSEGERALKERRVLNIVRFTANVRRAFGIEVGRDVVRHVLMEHLGPDGYRRIVRRQGPGQ